MLLLKSRLPPSRTAERALLDHAWPGNVRELKHLLERACVLADGPVLTPELLFGDGFANTEFAPAATLGDHMARRERDYILRALGFRWVRPFEYWPLRWLAALGYFFVARNRILVSKVLFKNEDGSSVF